MQNKEGTDRNGSEEDECENKVLTNKQKKIKCVGENSKNKTKILIERDFSIYFL